MLRRLATYFVAKHSEWGQPDFSDLLESSPDGLVITHSEGKISVVNSQTEILFGYSRQEMVGRPVEMLIPVRFGELHLKHRQSFVAEPRVRAMGAGLELFGRRKNGSEFPVDVSLSPLQTPKGIFCIAAVRDITERKRAEEQIKKLNAELGEALRRAERLGATGELAAGMASEIEKRLQTLNRLLSQLAAQAVEPVVKNLIDRAQDEVAHITEVTGSVISLHHQHNRWKQS